LKGVRILLVDDDESLLRILEHQLLKEGYTVTPCVDGSQALNEFEQGQYDVVVSDIQMPGLSGLDLLRVVKEKSEETVVILITAYGTIRDAVEAVRMGAADYLTKPFEKEELQLVIARSLKTKDLERENVELRSQLTERFSFDGMIGRSAKLDEVFRLVSKVAPRDTTVLILGESGTGKELLARAIHYASERKSKPFVTVNCSAIPENLVESELFGHVRGAFTGAIRDKKGKFEAADGGTIFLDEIGDLRLELQGKLLRVLQEMEFERVGGNQTLKVDVRVIAATNKDPGEAVARGEFREDLYYRLSVVPVVVPPLRERRDDIPLLVDHFLKKFSKEKRVGISQQALETLTRYDWPGNVRELENVIERAVVLSEGGRIEKDELPDFVNTDQTRVASSRALERDPSLEEIEREAIVSALDRTGWNQTQAARLLKIPRHVLIYRMKKMGIQKP
jgi:two-component system NtrC family response regulator